MTQKQNPTEGNRQGFRKNVVADDGKKNTAHPLSMQGLCADCAYFRVVKLPSGGIRHLCTFLGDKLPKAGHPLCTFRQGGEV